MTNWYETHDADGRYRDPVERWRQYDKLTINEMPITETDIHLNNMEQLMSDLAALCEELSSILSVAVQEKTGQPCTPEETTRVALCGMFNEDGSRRFPEVKPMTLREQLAKLDDDVLAEKLLNSRTLPFRIRSILDDALDQLDEMAAAQKAARNRISRLASMVEQEAGEMLLGQRTRQAVRILDSCFADVLARYEGRDE